MVDYNLSQIFNADNGLVKNKNLTILWKDLHSLLTLFKEINLVNKIYSCEGSSSTKSIKKCATILIIEGNYQKCYLLPKGRK